MLINYVPKSHLEKFGIKILDILSPGSYFVGGMVRDLLLKRKITDIDIATGLKPEMIIRRLGDNKIAYGDQHKNFGVILAKQGSVTIEITTFRAEAYGKSRFPKIQFIKNTKQDSQRRDFTVNALYFNPKDKAIRDFHNGVGDLQKKLVRFVGNPTQKIKEDPLRILRALRFTVDLNFKLEKQTRNAIKKHLADVSSLSRSKIEQELGKVKTKTGRDKIKKVINNPKTFDKYF